VKTKKIDVLHEIVLKKIVLMLMVLKILKIFKETLFQHSKFERFVK